MSGRGSIDRRLRWIRGVTPGGTSASMFRHGRVSSRDRRRGSLDPDDGRRRHARTDRGRPGVRDLHGPRRRPTGALSPAARHLGVVVRRSPEPRVARHAGGTGRGDVPQDGVAGGGTPPPPPPAPAPAGPGGGGGGGATAAGAAAPPR